MTTPTPTITLRADLDPLVVLSMVYALCYGSEADPDDDEFAMASLRHLFDKIVTGVAP
jgi:hypothetical protein